MLGSKSELGSKNENPSIGLAALLLEDLQTYSYELHEPGLWAVLVHRLGNARMDLAKPLRVPATAGYLVAHWALTHVFGIKLSYTVRLGRRVRIWHSGGMVLGARSIGDDVQIRQNTTFGVRNTGVERKPVIGNRVDIGAGACVLGAVEVLDDAAIGANAVVVDDVPEGSIVAGVPARIVRWKK